MTSNVAAGPLALSQSVPASTAGVHPASTPPPSSVGIFPLSQVHKGQMGTAWTVFEGTVPEPMEVEILGVLRGSRGPGRDLILARLHGSKPEYTGVVAGMSGSPVYIDGKLAGALSYKIGQFSKEPIAGITPIEQMLEVKDLPIPHDLQRSSGVLTAAALDRTTQIPVAGTTASLGENQTLGDGMTFAAMETPLVMSGFAPDSVRLWKEQMAGTGLDIVSAGGSGLGGTSLKDSDSPSEQRAAANTIVPGSAVSLQLVRGDMEIAATCTVTYVDPTQLLACGHPVQQSGPVSLPMTTTDVVATLASPLNAFKIVNTGRTIGSFTEDRDAAIRGVFGVAARMIPVSIAVDISTTGPKAGVDGPASTVQRNIEIVDMPSLTASAVLVSVYQTLLETNSSSARNSYHITGEITVQGRAPVHVDTWGTPNETMASQLAAALGVANAFNQLYTNASRLEPIHGVRLHVEVIPEDMRVELEGVRLISSSIVRAGDTVVLEATVRPWEQPERNLRIPFTLPARLEPGTLRLMVSSSAAVDRTLETARPVSRVPGETAAAAKLRGLHAPDRLYISLLLPESQASLEGQTLQSLPLSMANTLESERGAVDVGLNGESLSIVGDTAAGGVLSGQQLLTLRVEAGGGLH